MELFNDLIASMCASVPEGRAHLDAREISTLRQFTPLLLSAAPDSNAEYQRYLDVRHRSLSIPIEIVGNWVADKTILVTGGTGCVGSALNKLLSRLRPRRLVSVSRGIASNWPRATGVDYVRADVRDQLALESVVAQVRPDVLFHLAAQRDPGLAEQTVHETVTTNVLGTYNVIAAAESLGVPRVVFGSTGKTVIPYTADIYASSKRITEWLAANAAGRGNVICTAARFTHLVDNSIVHQRIFEGCAAGLIRLHGPRSAFYVQSALESAQLLICAGAETPGGSLGVHAISDLDWPVDLLSLALGAIGRTRSNPAIYFCGNDPGYRSNTPYPGQYDPELSWQLSPLVNAFEARETLKADYGHVDIFHRRPLTDASLDAPFLALKEACIKGDNVEEIRRLLDDLTWSVFEKTLDGVPHEALLRIAKPGIRRSPEAIAHPRISAAIEKRTRLA